MAAPYPNYTSYSAPASSTISTGATYGIISTYIASIDMDCSSQLVAVEQQTQAVAGVHYTYSSNLTEENTYKFLNSFNVVGYGPSGYTAGSNPLVVSVSNSTDFKAVIKAALDDKESAIEGSFVSDLQAQLRVWLQDDDLVNSVQNMFGTVTVALDTQDGADNMAAGYATNDYAEILYTQIPNSTLDDYIDASEEPVTSALPLRGGDKVTFVFDCSPVMQSFHYTQSPITTDGTGDVTTTPVPDAYAGTMPTITSQSRRFAVTLVMAGEGALNCASRSEGTAPNQLKA